MPLSGRPRVEVGSLRFIDVLPQPINGRRAVSETRNLRIGLASKHALNECRCFDESAFMRKPRCLEHHVIHIDSFPFSAWGANGVGGVYSRRSLFVIAFYRRE